MSDKTPKQSLITKQDDEEWAMVLHGEQKADTDNDTHAKAQLVRNYLIARDEVLALKEGDENTDLAVLSEEEARVIYQRATHEIHQRATSRFTRFKGFILPAIIGALSLLVVLLALPERYKETLVGVLFPDRPVISQAQAGLDYSNYKPMTVGVDPGDYPNMLLVENGTFMMGCTAGWDDLIGCRPNEYPAHQVSVKAFEIAQHEVTIRQFTKFVDDTGYKTDAEKESRGCTHIDLSAQGHPFVLNPLINWRNPGFPQEEQHPVTCVSWADAQAYIAWLSQQHSKQYRLPTEAEWEYAARGRKANAYHWGSEASPAFANYNTGPDGTEFTTVVGKYSANSYSIHDMAGNVWEWVEDCWHEVYDGAPTNGEAWTDNCNGSNIYTRRGGAYDAPPQGIRSANRSSGGKHDRSVFYGFRVASDYKPEKNISSPP
ncbi:formylglycine-generating enzyme family protein [Leucothrix sargassi]|nr:formylglycine-generating enzyme family protein [Leucothrix sargassi]